MYADILTWLKLILSSSISLLLPASFLAATSLKFRFFPAPSSSDDRKELLSQRVSFEYDLNWLMLYCSSIKQKRETVMNFFHLIGMDF